MGKPRSTRQYFCFCIPVRVAVFVTSLLALLFSGAVAAILFIILADAQNKNTAVSHLSSEQKISCGVVGAIYTLIALASLFGFIGSIIRKRGFVRIYSIMTYIILLVQCAASGYMIFSLFRHTNCTVPTANGTTQNCTQFSTSVKAALVAFLVFELLVQTYIVAVIRRYVTQLEDEETYRGTSGYADHAFRMNPVSYQPVDQSLLHPDQTYPYADPHHSFGDKPHA